MHQLAVLTTWQVQIANEYISRIDSAGIVPVARLMVALAQIVVAAGHAVVRVLGKPATATTEREVLIFAIVNAVVSLA